MSSADAEDRYALVSSFYGPGATVGWYFTTLASAVSFRLHPRKRSLDSITSDLIAVLVFPAVAAAHLIIQVRSYFTSLQPTSDLELAQYTASLEAALIIIETFLAIDVILFMLAVGFKCTKRGCLLAAIGLFCFSAESYPYFSRSVREAIKRDLARPFLIHFGNILISTMTLLLACIVLALGLVTIFFATHPTLSQVQTPGPSSEALLEDLERDFKHSQNATTLTWVTAILLPFSFVAFVYPLSSGAAANLPSQFLPWLSAFAYHIAHDLIPNSNVSFKDLDQAVAMFAGATVLGFSLYSTADDYYR